MEPNSKSMFEKYSFVFFKALSLRTIPNLVILFVLVLGLFQSEIASSEEEMAQYVCKHNGEVRILKNTRNEKKNLCQTVYNKNGKDAVMAEGQNKVTCEETLQKIKENLEKAGWSCRAVQIKKLANL